MVFGTASVIVSPVTITQVLLKNTVPFSNLRFAALLLQENQPNNYASSTPLSCSSHVTTAANHVPQALIFQLDKLTNTWRTVITVVPRSSFAAGMGFFWGGGGVDTFLEKKERVLNSYEQRHTYVEKIDSDGYCTGSIQRARKNKSWSGSIVLAHKTK